jgi:hypothetical protein
VLPKPVGEVEMDTELGIPMDWKLTRLKSASRNASIASSAVPSPRSEELVTAAKVRAG